MKKPTLTACAAFLLAFTDHVHAAKLDNECGKGCFHGFLPSRSKTDIFKLDAIEETFCLNVFAQIDTSEDTLPAAYWDVFVTDAT